MESLIDRIYDLIQQIPNILFQYSNSLPKTHEDKVTSAKAAINIMDYINRMIALSFTPISMIDSDGIVYSQLSEKRKSMIDHFGLFFSEKSKF
jgi:hypothetical protein